MGFLSEWLNEAEENVHLEYVARRECRENVSKIIGQIRGLKNYVSEQRGRMSDLRAAGGTSEETVKALEERYVFKAEDKIKVLEKKLEAKILSLGDASDVRLQFNTALWEKLKTWLAAGGIDIE